jgi:beta-lactamase superfamily II metal-dependent hydrolase
VRLAVTLVWLALPAIGRAAPLRVTFLSVGQGDATLIRSPAGKRVLVDGGPPEAAEALVRALRADAATLDLVLLTHRHVDHLGGLRRAIAAVGARLFLDAPSPHAAPGYARLLRLLEARHVPVRDAAYGRRVDLGGDAVLELLGPPSPPLSHTRSDVNANGVVARLDYRRASVLLAADAEAPTERWLLARGAPLRARVLKVAHHGSPHSSTAPFLRAVAPEAAVVSVGALNEYHHPSPATLARLRAVGARIYRTDLDGDVRLESDGEQIAIAGSRSEAQR